MQIKNLKEIFFIFKKNDLYLLYNFFLINKYFFLDKKVVK